MNPMVTNAEVEAELALAGIAIGWSRRTLEVDVEPEHFHDMRWRKVWGAARSMASAGRTVDPITLADEIGITAITVADCANAMSRMPTADNAEHYAEIVRDGAVRRLVAEAAGYAIEAAKRGEGGADLLSEVMRRLSAIHVEGSSEVLTVRDLLKQRYQQLADLAQAKSRGELAATGIPTGLPSLDAMLGGLQRGIVTVAAGRPGMGKSSFGLTVARHASSIGIGVHVFSLEDTREAYSDRVISNDSHVPAERIRQVALERGDLPRIAESVDRHPATRPWLIEDRAGISAEEIVRSIRGERERNKTQLAVIDYVQLIKGPPKMPREESLTHVMNILSDAAKQERISILLLAQLNRECEKRDDKRPILSDLKAAGAIEERAKCVVMLYRPVVYEPNKPRDLVELIVRKNNQGAIGTATALWDGPTIRMHGGGR